MHQYSLLRYPSSPPHFSIRGLWNSNASRRRSGCGDGRGLTMASILGRASPHSSDCTALKQHLVVWWALPSVSENLSASEYGLSRRIAMHRPRHCRLLPAAAAAAAAAESVDADVLEIDKLNVPVPSTLLDGEHPSTRVPRSRMLRKRQIFAATVPRLRALAPQFDLRSDHIGCARRRLLSYVHSFPYLKPIENQRRDVCVRSLEPLRIGWTVYGVSTARAIFKLSGLRLWYRKETTRKKLKINASFIRSAMQYRQTPFEKKLHLAAAFLWIANSINAVMFVPRHKRNRTQLKLATEEHGWKFGRFYDDWCSI